MRPLSEWRACLAELPESAEVRLEQGRGGATIVVNGVYLHSRYNPEQEAQRYVASLELDLRRPVLMVGLGLGYHVRALQALGLEVVVTEPNPAVARLALEQLGPEVDFPLLAGDLAQEVERESFREFARRIPQVLVHPPAARVVPEAVEAAVALLCQHILRGQHLSIAIVGPMYGGSLPIAQYLADGFGALGHRVRVIDNSVAWSLYQTVTKSVKAQTASAQLGQIMANFLSEWSYTRVVEFDPEICIVLAQAPVNQQFPARLAKRDIISAFWFVENWRHLPYWQNIAPHYDSFFHIQPGEFEEKLEAIGCKDHEFVQTGCDPRKHFPVTLTPEEAEEYTCDISFAGAGYYNRLQLFRGLTDYDFKIWGVDWPDRELARRVAGGERRFDSEAFMKMVAGTKVNLNLHSSTTSDGVDANCDAINPRVFEIAAAGGFQVCDACQGIETHFDPDSELPLYRSLPELRKMIDHFLEHPEERQRFAEKARQRALGEHTYRHRAGQMLDHLFARHGLRMLKKGVRVQRTVGEMAERLPAESALRAWLEELPPELLFLQEALATFIKPGVAGMSEPEKLFTYMKEVREFADTVIKTKR